MLFVNHACYFIYKYRCECKTLEEGKCDRRKKVRFYSDLEKKKKEWWRIVKICGLMS